MKPTSRRIPIPACTFNMATKDPSSTTRGGRLLSAAINTSHTCEIGPGWTLPENTKAGGEWLGDSTVLRLESLSSTFQRR